MVYYWFSLVHMAKPWSCKYCSVPPSWSSCKFINWCILSLLKAHLESGFLANVPIPEQGASINIKSARGNWSEDASLQFHLIGKLNSKKVLIIDDVLTAGTAIKNSLKIIKNENAELCAVLVALDREEKDDDNNFYRDNLFNEGIKIFSIAKISELD